MIPRIVERFPKYRSRVLNALPRDGTMAELCEDYDKVVAVLEAEETRSAEGGEISQEAHRELVRLKRELEFELLERLATSDEPEGDG